MTTTPRMNAKGTLQDKSGQTWIRFENVRASYGAFVAPFEFVDVPPEARVVFEEHERHILRQELSFLDEFRRRISGFGLEVVWEGDPKRTLALDVQTCEGEVSFRSEALARK